MIAVILVILITILVVAHFYLKYNSLTSFVTAISALLGMLFAFNFYELLGGLFLQKGYIPSVANGICFLLLFGICFALFRVLSGLLVGSSIDLGQATKAASAIVFGLITSFIISGCLLISLNMAGTSPKLSYKRFDGAISRSAIEDPQKCKIPTDDVTANLFGWISNGALSGKNSFAVYHADFINQLHLSKHNTKDGIIPVSSPDAIKIPKHGVRKKETKDGKEYTAIRLEIDASKIDRGGAANKDGGFGFALYQIRLICVPSGSVGTISAEATVLYPGSNISTYTSSKPNKQKIEFGNLIKMSKDQLAIAKSKKIAVLDLSFNIPSGLKPILLEFKNTAVVAVPAVTKAEDAEEQINAIFKKE